MTKKLKGLDVRAVSEDETAFMNVLLYGDTGVGKTTLAGSSVEVLEMNPVLLLDIEDGRASLRELYDVDYIPIRTIRELEKAYEGLAGEDHGYKTVVVDNISELQMLGMVEILAAEGKDDPDKKKNVMFVNADTPDWKHYHKSTEQIRRIVQYFRRLPMNSIFVAWMTVDEERDKQGNVRNVTKRPSLTTKAAKQSPGFVNDVWYMYDTQTAGKDAKTERHILTQKKPGIIAKHRDRKLDRIVHEPTMAEIYKTIYG